MLELQLCSRMEQIVGGIMVAGGDCVKNNVGMAYVLS